MDHSAVQVPVDLLPDEQVLQLCQQQVAAAQQEEMSELLVKNREGALAPLEQRRLDELMQVYRQGLVRKAEALKVAIENQSDAWHFSFGETSGGGW